MNSVIFSESFLTEGNFDHQFRITIQDDKLTMDYVKIDENDDLEYTFTKEIESYGTLDLSVAKKKIIDNIDLRTDKLIQAIKVPENFEELSEDNKIKLNNENYKIETIIELYTYLKNYYFNKLN